MLYCGVKMKGYPMNEYQAGVLLSQIRFAMSDRYASKVAKATNIDARTVRKITGGDENIRPSIIRRLCKYLEIHIPTETN